MDRRLDVKFQPLDRRTLHKKENSVLFVQNQSRGKSRVFVEHKQSGTFWL